MGKQINVWWKLADLLFSVLFGVFLFGLGFLFVWALFCEVVCLGFLEGCFLRGFAGRIVKNIIKDVHILVAKCIASS